MKMPKYTHAMEPMTQKSAIGENLLTNLTPTRTQTNMSASSVVPYTR